jgi:hypothetical protein
LIVHEVGPVPAHIALHRIGPTDFPLIIADPPVRMLRCAPTRLNHLPSVPNFGAVTIGLGGGLRSSSVSTRRPNIENPLSLWHGLAANWQDRVTRHLFDTAHSAMQHGLALQRELSEARSLTDVAAAHGAATRRMVETIVERTGALSDLGATMRQELAATIRPDAEPPVAAE